MNHNLIYSVIGDFWKTHSRAPLFNQMFEGYSAALVDTALQIDQLKYSMAVGQCPIEIEHTWLYRDVEDKWEDNGTFHEHVFEKFVSAGATTFTFSNKLRNTIVFYNGKKLEPSDGYIITEDDITFPFTVPVGDYLYVYGERFYKQAYAGTSSTFTGELAEESVKIIVDKWDITNLCTFSGATNTVTLKDGTFYKGENLVVTEGLTTQEIFINSTREYFSVAPGFTAPTIERKFNVEFHSRQLYLDGAKIVFEMALPPGSYFKVKDLAGGEVVYVTTRSKSFSLTREYDENTLDVLFMGGSVYAIELDNAAGTISTTTPFRSDVDAYIYGDYHSDHTHRHFHEEVTVKKTTISLTHPLDVTLPFKVFVNGVYLWQIEDLVVIDPVTIKFIDVSTGFDYWLQPNDIVDVYYVDITEWDVHKHIFDEQETKKAIKTLTLDHYVCPDDLAVEVYINGKLYDTAFSGDYYIVVFDSYVSALSDVTVDGAAFAYPYYVDLDEDLTLDYFNDLGIPESYLVKAETIQDTIVGTTTLTWRNADEWPVDPSFTIVKMGNPSWVRLYSCYNWDDLWLKDAYVCEYTTYNNFGAIFGLDRNNSIYYRNVVLAFMEASWKGSQLYTIENFADIILGSEFTAITGEQIISRYGDVVETTEATYTAYDDYDLRTLRNPKLPKHHAFSKMLWEEFDSEYFAVLAQKSSDDFAIASRLDNRTDVVITGNYTGFAVGVSTYTITDAAANFVDGTAGEVYIGDMVYFKNAGLGVEFYGRVKTFSATQVVVDQLPNYLAYYYGPTVDGTYRIYSRKTDRLIGDSHFDQVTDLTEINGYISAVLPLFRVFKLAWECQRDGRDNLDYCRQFMDRIIPIFNKYGVYSEYQIDMGVQSTNFSTYIADHLAGTDLINYIDVGVGGDYDPVTLTDMGMRVAPVSTETVTRKLITRLPAIVVQTSVSQIVVIAVAYPEQIPTYDIDELALINDSGEMVSHFVFEEVDTNDRAKKYSKTGFQHMFFKWVIDL